MVGSYNFFNSLAHLEPRCPKCDTVLEYDRNTRFNDKLQAQECLGCGAALS